MQSRRPPNQSDGKLNPRALAAIAEAARRSRQAGVGPEPRQDWSASTPAYPASDQTAAATATQATQPAVTTSPSDRSPTVSVAAPEMVSTAEPRAGSERSGHPTRTAPPTAPSAAGLRWAGSPPPAGSAAFVGSLPGVPRRPARPPGSDERRLRWAIGIAFTLLVVVVAALVGTTNNGGGQPDRQATAANGSSGSSTGRMTGGSTGTASGQGVASSGSTPTAPTAISAPTSPLTSAPPSAAPPEPSGPPALSALAPATGRAGQTVTLTGSNFMSSSGHISAQVGGQVAPVACPTQTTCTVVVPPDPGPGPSAPVTITTDSGTSNAIPFVYGTPATLGVLHGPPACAGAAPCPGRNHGAGRHRPRH